jgi:hypothetical protein
VNAAALTAPVPVPLTAECAECGRETAAPVAVRWSEKALQHACPECAPLLAPGPVPGETVSGHPARAGCPGAAGVTPGPSLPGPRAPG